MNAKQEETRPDLRAGDDRLVPPTNRKRRRAHRGITTGILWIASALILAAIVAIFPERLQDDLDQNVGVQPASLSSTEIIRLCGNR